MADYRFQVCLNWDRSRYFLTLNLAFTVFATGMLQFATDEFSFLVTAMYVLGAVFCVLSVVALRAQRTYYLSARAQKKRLEAELGKYGIAVLANSDEKPRRRATFKVCVDIMFIILAITNITFTLFVVVS